MWLFRSGWRTCSTAPTRHGPGARSEILPALVSWPWEISEEHRGTLSIFDGQVSFGAVVTVLNEERPGRNGQHPNNPKISDSNQVTAPPPMRHRRSKHLATANNAVTARPPQMPGEHQLALLSSPRGLIKAPSSIPVPLDGGGVGLSWDFIRTGAAVGLPVALRSLLQVINTLAVRHRDLTKPPKERSFGALCPANLLFTRDGSALLPVEQQTVEQPLRYAAPECRAGLPPDQHSDIFALGVMLLETLVGRELGDDEATDLTPERAEKDPKLATFSSDGLFHVALKALAAKPEARWSGVGDLAEALVAASDGRLAPRSSLASAVAAALSRQGERATPVVQGPDVPKAPAAPVFDLTSSGTYEHVDLLGAMEDELAASDRITSVQVQVDRRSAVDAVAPGRSAPHSDADFEALGAQPNGERLPPLPIPLPKAPPARLEPPVPMRTELVVLSAPPNAVSAISGTHELSMAVGRGGSRRRWLTLLAVALSVAACLAFWASTRQGADEDAGLAAAAPKPGDVAEPAKPAPGAQLPEVARPGDGTQQPEATVARQVAPSAPSGQGAEPEPNELGAKSSPPSTLAKPARTAPKKEAHSSKPRAAARKPNVSTTTPAARRYDPEGI